VGRLRAVRRLEKPGELVVLSAADPLNLVGILTPEAKVSAVYRNRVLLQDGLPVAALEGGEVRRLADSPLGDSELKTMLARRSLRHPLLPHLRQPTAREAAMLARKNNDGEVEQAVAPAPRH
jgi:ATP-dependent Lhr-like helicase